MDWVQALFSLITYLVVVAIIFLIVRALVLWYWRIDTIVSALEEQNELLTAQAKKLEYIAQWLEWRAQGLIAAGAQPMGPGSRHGEGAGDQEPDATPGGKGNRRAQLGASVGEPPH